MDNKEKIILGVMGEIGSGKGTVTSYITKNYNAGFYRDSKTLRSILDILYLDYNRSNLGTLANSLRETFGEDIIARVTLKELMKLDNDVVIADGTRRIGELEFLKKNDNYTLLYVDVDIQRRYDRIKQRGQKTDDIEKTLEEFKKDHEDASDRQVFDMKESADHILDNNGSIEDLYRQIDKVMMRIKENNK